MTAASTDPAPAETLAPTAAWPARAVSEAEAPLTARTDRYMAAAAHALARAAEEMLRDRRAGVLAHSPAVLVLAGGGHNGGDALLAAARLAHRHRVTALLATDHPHAGALAAARAAGVAILAGDGAVAAARAATADGPALVIDGLTGIGATGPLRPAAAALVEPLIGAGPRGARRFAVLAVDVPSGTGVDDGTVAGPVLAADRTVTFTCLQGAHLLPPAAPLAGRFDVVDLGLPVPPGSALAARPDDAALAALLRVPGDTDHKYTRGVVGAWAGSEPYPGAAVLAVGAAIRTGAGLVRLLAPRRVEDLVLASRPEAVLADGRCQALLLGPGTTPTAPGQETRTAELRAALARALDEGIPAVVDAGALPLAAEAMNGGQRLTARQVLTPHAGEAAGLLSALGHGLSRAEVEAVPATAARELARLTGATVLLKGTPTLIAPADGSPLLSVDAGPGWLATAGSGDVLAGILAAVLAAGQADAERRGMAVSPDEASRRAALAARIHATAGAIASRSEHGPGRPIAAGDLVSAIPAAIERLRA